MVLVAVQGCFNDVRFATCIVFTILNPPWGQAGQSMMPHGVWRQPLRHVPTDRPGQQLQGPPGEAGVVVGFGQVRCVWCCCGKRGGVTAWEVIGCQDEAFVDWLGDWWST